MELETLTRAGRACPRSYFSVESVQALKLQTAQCRVPALFAFFLLREMTTVSQLHRGQHV